MAMNYQFVLNLAKLLDGQSAYLETESAPPEGGSKQRVRLNIPNTVPGDSPPTHTMGDRVKAQDMQDRLVAFHRVIAEKAGIKMDFYTLDLTTTPHQYSYLVYAQKNEHAEIQTKLAKTLEHVAHLDPTKLADKKELDALAAKVDVVFHKLDTEHRHGFEQELKYQLNEQKKAPAHRSHRTSTSIA